MTRSAEVCPNLCDYVSMARSIGLPRRWWEGSATERFVVRLIFQGGILAWMGSCQDEILAFDDMFFSQVVSNCDLLLRQCFDLKL
jgi:hypothetical protein